MANLIRSSKSGSDWARNELLAYNIDVRNASDNNFFVGGEYEEVGRDILDGTPESKRVLQYLDLASHADQDAIDDFARELLRVLKFETDDTLLRARFAIPLEISEDVAQSDVCLVHVERLILLILKTMFSLKDPEPQVIAEAIAAFQYNNKNRKDKEELDRMIIPCITMIGTFPRFYLIPVTSELSEAVITGQYPKNKTIVLRYTPKVEGRRRSQGMGNKDNMKEILRCYSLFRKTAQEHYSKFLE
ncbi:hypothetical protein K439DRAFT_1546032, partial [Ramaria rubella]